jgi:hypothetical protein
MRPKSFVPIHCPLIDINHLEKLCSRIVTLGIGKRGYFILRWVIVLWLQVKSCGLQQPQWLGLWIFGLSAASTLILFDRALDNKLRNSCHDKTTIHLILYWSTFFVRAHGLDWTQIHIRQVDLSLSWSMLMISHPQLASRYTSERIHSIRMTPPGTPNLYCSQSWIFSHHPSGPNDPHPTSFSLPPHSRRYRNGHKQHVCFVTQYRWTKVFKTCVRNVIFWYSPMIRRTVIDVIMLIKLWQIRLARHTRRLLSISRKVAIPGGPCFDLKSVLPVHLQYIWTRKQFRWWLVVIRSSFEDAYHLLV